MAWGTQKVLEKLQEQWGKYDWLRHMFDFYASTNGWAVGIIDMAYGMRDIHSL